MYGFLSFLKNKKDYATAKEVGHKLKNIKKARYRALSF